MRDFVLLFPEVVLALTVAVVAIVIAVWAFYGRE
jgi:hypothetical protein